MEQKLPFKQSMSRLEEIIAALEKMKSSWRMPSLCLKKDCSW